jgi:TM2 domain-containing membrane protein YozV
VSALVEREETHSKGTAYLLWLAWTLGFCGIHRFYLGRPWTGLLWLFTFGLLGVGQLIDLFRIPGMVRKQNALLAGAPVRLLAPPAEDVEIRLARAAARHGGQLSVAQAVVETGLGFKAAEAALDDMARAGYVDIGNDDDTGAVVYRFGKLTGAAAAG